jgi:hypothetical protein
MTLHEDDAVRDALVALMPVDLEPPLDRIHSRALQRRRRARVRAGVGVVSLAALVALTLSALPGGAAHRSLDISTRPSRARHAATTVVPTTKRPVTTTIPAVAPTTAHVVVVPTFPTATTVPSVAPTTVPRFVLPPLSVSVTPTTAIAPAPTTVPVAAYERITLILDDSGLHAPDQITTAKQVDVIFLDQRTSATSVPDTGVRITTTDGQSGVILRSYHDPDCCAWFGAIGTVFHPLGVVTFQGVDTATNYSDIPSLYTTTKFVPS